MTGQRAHHTTPAATPAGPVRPGEPGWEDRLMALVARLSRLCADLDAMGDRQASLITGDDVDALLELLRDRQGVIDSIAAVAGQLDPVVKGWDELSETLDEATRGRVKGQLDEIEAAGKRIGERDAEHRRTLESQRNALADRIAGVGRAGGDERVRARRPRAAVPGPGGVSVAGETNKMTTPTVAGLSETDLADLIGSFNEVTRKLEGTHDRLRSEVERLNAELRRANERLERSRRLAALGEMAAGIAHEIRNPLGSIGLYARLLEQDLSDRPERRTAQKIRSAVSRLDEVVIDVLTFAREMRVDVAPAEASDLLDRAVEGCRHVLGSVRRDDQARPALALACDEGLVVQALVNVVRNAAEANDEAAGGAGDKPIVLDARTEVDDDGDRVVLSVRDAGPGIGADVIDRMFNPFFTTRAAGTGLGLAIVHRIVEAHGGRVVVRNNEGLEPGARGATVELWLPAAAPDAPSVDKGDEERGVEVRVRGGVSPTRAA